MNIRSTAYLVLALVSGCASLGGISQSPSVTLADIGLEDFGLLEQRFALRLRVQNPNNVDIPVSGLTYELEVNGEKFARGVSDKAVTVPRYGEAVLDVSAVSNLSSLLRQLSEMEKAGKESITYRLKGQLNLGNWGNAVPFDHRGEVALPKLPAFSPAKPGRGDAI